MREDKAVDEMDPNGWPGQALMLDANAAAGILYDVFSAEMTASPTECAHCGREGEVGTLLAFMQGPGIILRCPACEDVVLRWYALPARSIWMRAVRRTCVCDAAEGWSGRLNPLQWAATSMCIDVAGHAHVPGGVELR